MKKTKKFTESHTPRSSKGLGDYRGTGIKAKIGKIRDGIQLDPLPKNIGKPPRTLA